MSNPVFNVHTSPYVDVFLVILIILIVNLKKNFVAPYNLWDISSLTRDWSCQIELFKMENSLKTF